MKLKKYVWLLLAMWLPLGFVACSDSDDPETEVDPTPIPDVTPEYYTQTEPYINQFCYEQIDFYYLWVKEAEKEMESWKLDDDPAKKVDAVRYTEDRWTMAIENIKPYTEPATTTTGTFGYDFALYWADETKTNIYAVVTMVYPDSPAEKAGLKRGSVIMQKDGKDIQNNSADINALLSSSSLDLTVAYSINELNAPKSVRMNAADMYLEPVLHDTIFECGAKKVGYLFYNDFTMESTKRLIEVASIFKDAGVTELILDLRYNGGGYVVTEELLASLLAPWENVNAGDLFQTEVYNDTKYAQALEKAYGTDFDKSYFKTRHAWKYKDQEYDFDTSDFNIGLTKIYALVSSSSASASEAILVSLMPYMDIEIIGQQTHGKFCAGVMFEAEDFYQDYEDYLDELKDKDRSSYNEIYSQFWKKYTGWKEYVKDWGIYVMVSTYADKNGKNPCRPNGLQPDVEVEDNPREPYQLGDDREALLREALTLAGYENLTPLSKSVSRAADAWGEQIRFKKEEGRLIHLQPEMAVKAPLKLYGR